MCDFDNVLHKYNSGWKGVDVIPDLPVPGAMEFLEDAVEKFDVCIYSSRSSQPTGVSAMRIWLRKHLTKKSGMDNKGMYVYQKLRFPTTKPPAFITIDDRAITFNGTFPSIDSLLSFKPWNKK